MTQNINPFIIAVTFVWLGRIMDFSLTFILSLLSFYLSSNDSDIRDNLMTSGNPIISTSTMALTDHSSSIYTE